MSNDECPMPKEEEGIGISNNRTLNARIMSVGFHLEIGDPTLDIGHSYGGQ
jgi:hypothetical protein